MSHPVRIRILRMPAPIQKYLTMAGSVVFEEHNQECGGLNQLEREQRAGVRESPRETVRPGRVFGVVRRTLPLERVSPWQRLRFAGIARPLRVPDSGQVRLAVRRARSGAGRRGMWLQQRNSEFPAVS